LPEIEKIRLKGGSLAGTFLVKENNRTYIRKEINRTIEREYGFQRWYSQLKKLQRFNKKFPDLFCKVLDYGVLENSTICYFDLKYYENSVNVQEFLETNKDTEQITKIFNSIINNMQKIHSHEIPSFVNSIDLYLEEEVNQKINDCLFDSDFALLYSKNHITFQNEKIQSFSLLYGEYKKNFKQLYKKPIESYTHGNITLENMLFIPQESKIVFIDPYEENIIDNKYNEYSQILQSCNSHYEIYNSLTCFEESPRIPYGIRYFDKLFKSYLKANLSNNEVDLVKMFEISQFIRMLPFKIKNEKEKAMFFYSLASKLLNDFLGGKG
jgi:hypothetical protein